MLGALVVDVLFLIVQKLNARDLSSLSQVSRIFYDFVSQNLHSAPSFFHVNGFR
jgi:hypothetical protein